MICVDLTVVNDGDRLFYLTSYILHTGVCKMGLSLHCIKYMVGLEAIYTTVATFHT